MTDKQAPASAVPPRVFRYVTIRDSYTWYSEHDRVCDPAVNEKTTYVPESAIEAARKEQLSAMLQIIELELSSISRTGRLSDAELHGAKAFVSKYLSMAQQARAGGKDE